MSYIDYPIKCQACGLHYTVHSWQEDWHQTDGGKTRSGTNGGVCPECGVIGGKILFTSEKRDGQIFEVVGHNHPTEITAVVAPGIGYGGAAIERITKEEGASAPPSPSRSPTTPTGVRPSGSAGSTP